MDVLILVLACYGAVVSTAVAIRQQRRINGEWEVLRHKQDLGRRQAAQKLRGDYDTLR